MFGSIQITEAVHSHLQHLQRNLQLDTTGCPTIIGCKVGYVLYTWYSKFGSVFAATPKLPTTYQLRPTHSRKASDLAQTLESLVQLPQQLMVCQSDLQLVYTHPQALLCEALNLRSKQE